MKSRKFFFGVVAVLFVIGLFFFFFFFGTTSQFFAKVSGVERVPNTVGIVRVSSVVEKVVPGVKVSVDKAGVVQVVDGQLNSVVVS